MQQDLFERSIVGVGRRVAALARRWNVQIRRLRPEDLGAFEAASRLLRDTHVSTVFDVGANKGQSARKLSALFPDADILCFEPTKSTYDSLVTETRHLKSVSSYEIALGDGDGDAELHTNRGSVTNSILVNSARSGIYSDPDLIDPVGTELVRLRSLSSFCSERGIHTIDLLKIDTQGYELKVLKGAGPMLSPAKIRLVVAEVLFVSLYEGQCYFEDVYTAMKAAGYSLYGLYNVASDLKNGIKWADGLFH